MLSRADADHFALLQFLVQRRVTLQMRLDPRRQLQSIRIGIDDNKEDLSVFEFQADEPDHFGLETLQVGRFVQLHERNLLLTPDR